MIMAENSKEQLLGMNLNEKHTPIFILAPHTDDGEIGCGGLISKCVEAGLEVWYIAFSSAQISLPPGAPKDTLIKEVNAATTVLGIPKNRLVLFDFETRTFPAYRQEILDEMIVLRNKIQPKLIFIPSLNDIHQDHATIAHESIRCFKKQSILCYEEPWNNISFSTNCFIKLEDRHLEKKIEALNCYESQKKRSYLNNEAIKGMALMRGTQLEGGYAEAFEVVRWML